MTKIPLTIEESLNVLGLQLSGLTTETLKKAYRKAARENHPDANFGDKEAEERFKAVQSAYENLDQYLNENSFTIEDINLSKVFRDLSSMVKNITPQTIFLGDDLNPTRITSLNKLINLYSFRIGQEIKNLPSSKYKTPYVNQLLQEMVQDINKLLGTNIPYLPSDTLRTIRQRIIRYPEYHMYSLIEYYRNLILEDDNRNELTEFYFTNKDKYIRLFSVYQPNDVLAAFEKVVRLKTLELMEKDIHTNKKA